MRVLRDKKVFPSQGQPADSLERLQRTHVYFVAIDYFTKLMEAASFVKLTKAQLAHFIKQNITCRYDLSPSKWIMLETATMIWWTLCMQLKIYHQNSTPYRSKMNGAVEAANKSIKKVLQKMIETYQDCIKLPFALFAYRTSIWSSSEGTPCSLFYGKEAILLIEIKIPSLWILMETKLEEAKWSATNPSSWILLKKKGCDLCHGQYYRKRIARAYDKKIKPRTFEKGDLVLTRFIYCDKSFDRRSFANI